MSTKKRETLVDVSLLIYKRSRKRKWDIVKKEVKKEMISKGLIKPYKRLPNTETIRYIIDKLFEMYNNPDVVALNELKNTQIENFKDKL